MSESVTSAYVVCGWFLDGEEALCTVTHRVLGSLWVLLD